MMEYFKEDIKRYFCQEKVENGLSIWRMTKEVLLNESLWIIVVYRYGRWLRIKCKIPVLLQILKVLYFIPAKLVCVVLGQIDLRADIGRGLYIGHSGGILIGPVKMGEYCNISQRVVIGIGGRGEARGIPEIGNRVYFGPGAIVFGRITIGNNVAIGPNAVLSKSVPDNAVVLGNPGRIVSYEGSEGLIESRDELFFRSVGIQ